MSGLRGFKSLGEVIGVKLTMTLAATVLVKSVAQATSSSTSLSITLPALLARPCSTPPSKLAACPSLPHQTSALATRFFYMTWAQFCRFGMSCRRVLTGKRTLATNTGAPKSCRVVRTSVNASPGPKLHTPTARRSGLPRPLCATGLKAACTSTLLSAPNSSSSGFTLTNFKSPTRREMCHLQ